MIAVRSPTVDRLDTRNIGADVADLLQRAWAPPCIWYSPEYLRWEFASPGRRQAIAFGAFEGAATPRGLVGFIGAVPRRARVGGWIGDVWLLSFVAVSPDRRRRGLARRLYAELLSMLSGSPIVIFTHPDTAGEHLRRTSLAAASHAYATRELRVCRTYGASLASSSDCAVESVADYETWMRLLQAHPSRDGNNGGDDRLPLEAWPDAAAFEHARLDPRGRTFHLIRDTGGRPIAGAAAFHAITRTADGVQQTPSIECLVLHDETPATAAAVIRHPRFATATSAIVLAPNLSTVDERVLRAAGLRGTRSEFLVHLAAPPGHPALAACCTNFEVV